MDSLNFNSVETLPNLSARAAFQVNSSAVFKEDVDIVPVIIDDTLSYMPWGGDNNMPFDILKLIEDDETLPTCQMFNAEVRSGNGLVYKYRPSAQVRGYGLEVREVRGFESLSSPQEHCEGSLAVLFVAYPLSPLA